MISHAKTVNEASYIAYRIGEGELGSMELVYVVIHFPTSITPRVLIARERRLGRCRRGWSIYKPSTMGLQRRDSILQVGSLVLVLSIS